jgi:short subunit dehydrogenase-like uncharacterized protein
MAFQPSWILYGASGYTGTLIAEAAVKAGLKPILAGRSATNIEPLAKRLGLNHRVFALEQRGKVEHGLAGIRLVLNAAGPFVLTAQPLAQASIATGAHYLDISGEVADFRALHRMHERAADNGTMVLPGVGFGVLPTDCLALKLHQLLPHAAIIKLGVITGAGASKGTLNTLFECSKVPGFTHKRGQLQTAELGEANWQVKIDGLANARLVNNPWRGDLFSVPLSIPIQHLESYFELPGSAQFLLSKRALLHHSALGRWIWKLAKLGPEGPSAATRAKQKSVVLAYGIDPDRREKTLVLQGPNAYDVTAEAAVDAVKRVLGGAIREGFATPAIAFGSEPLQHPMWRLIER